ncbi:ABC transporter ATP-binding protein [Actinomyces viscosus]|uniref:Glutathione import ATP-binding protein GsiA n=1 Tax=Actinomyces viscosus TaxID=1656 RepID=A0A3S4VC44_ACTVI|nr:ABC transporter ATP-binding protein [Actinomyces viscosus]TFH53120.1 ABC transporter ATP-binding protein [Actinomyces viscosus]VEI14232.1 Glutathione import ATP-binding protein GsiA [Actinomyces viscosus]
MSAPTTTPAPTASTDAESRLIEVENLTVTFHRPGADGGHEVRAVRGLDLTIAPGEAVGIVGESGSGKSVTARTLIGLTGGDPQISATRLEVAGQDATDLTDAQWRTIRGRRIGLILQDALTSLDPLRTIGKEIAEALRLADVVNTERRATGERPLSGRALAAAEREQAIALLEEVGIPEADLRVDQYPHELSGGLRQRALIASAIAGRPDLIIADEPTTALDVTVQAQVLDVLAARRATGSALLLISHDLAVVGQVCDRILVMKDGEVVESGPSQAVLTSPRHAYTRRLLAAVPSAASRGRLLATDARAPQRQNLSESADAEPLLAARDLVKDYPGPGGTVRRAVGGVDVEVRPGQTLGVVGESGSGKSTLARLLIALTEPDTGTIALDAEPWSPLPDRRRRTRRHRIQIINQDPISSFDPRYSVRDVIAEPLRSPAAGRRRPGRAQVAERVREVAELVGLPLERLDASPLALSGGQRQRVAIARALVTEPDILIADEPVSALDVSIQAQILDLLVEVRARTGAAIIFISHDLGVVHHLADDVLVMKDGQVVESGDVDTVFTRPAHPYTRRLLEALPSLPAAEAA